MTLASFLAILFGTLLLIVLALIVLFYLFRKLWFSRDPVRHGPKDPALILSPANGTVVVVERFDTTKAASVTARKWNKGRAGILCKDVDKKGWFVLIVMTPLNVHYQRAPVEGTVVSSIRTPGKFLNAVKEPEKLLALENEKNEILLTTAHGKVKVVQIAGYLARRIHSYVAPGKRVKRGATIGFIDLGSQVALVLPERARVRAKPGDTVIDGETVIGVFS